MSYKNFLNIRINKEESPKYHKHQGFIASDFDVNEFQNAEEEIEIQLDMVSQEVLFFKIKNLEYFDSEEKTWKDLKEKL